MTPGRTPAVPSRPGVLPRRAGGSPGLRAAALLPAVLAAALAATVATPRGVRGQALGEERDDRPVPIDVDAAPRPEARVVRTTLPVRIDGRLDDEAWAAADVIDGFVQSQPDPGMPATEPTVVRMLMDDEHLYIGAVAYDSEPGGWVVRSLEHDFPGLSTRDADIFSVTLDTFHDRRNGFIWLVNPFGAYRDGQAFNDSRNVDFGWDGVVRVETTIHDEGWTVEMAIPWATLRFDPDGGGTWGANFLRRVRRKNEDSYWAPVDRRDPVHRMSRAGTIHGFEGLSAGRNLQIKPYALTDDKAGPDVGAGERGADATVGMDLKYGLTPTLTLDLTVNTDFSQVEVDEERVNLTRFPLFFPEQREFFVENSGSFTFGDLTERSYRMGASLRDFTLFHSRRIGLRAGRPVPIVAGGRVTGSLGPFEVGVLNIQTGGEELGTATEPVRAPAENFTVARLRREVFSGGDVGFIYIRRDPTDAGFGGQAGTSWGVDGNVRVLGSLIVNSYLARSRNPGLDGDDWAGRLSAAWRDRYWNASAMYRRIGRDFDPSVGFVRRRGIRQGYVTVGTHRRPSLPFVSELAPYVELDYITDEADVLATREGRLGLDADFLDGGRLQLSVTDRFERLEDPFPVQGGASVAPGDYDFVETSASYTSSAGRPVAGTVRVGGGGFFDGTRRSLGLEGRFQGGARLSVDVSADYNRIELPGVEPFDRNVYGARVKYGFSTRVFASALVQYNQATEEVVSNVRFNWIHAPLSDLFLVLTERRNAVGTGLLERVATLKVTKLVAF